MLRLLGKRIAVVPPPPEVTPSGIVLAETQKPLKGQVFLAAHDAIRQGIETGAVVHFSRHAGQRVPMTSGPHPELLILTTDEVLAIE